MPVWNLAMISVILSYMCTYHANIDAQTNKRDKIRRRTFCLFDMQCYACHAMLWHDMIRYETTRYDVRR